MLDPVEGHEQAGTRPVLIISNEPFNQRSGLVTVLPLTTARRPPFAWEVALPASACGLPADSLVLPNQVRTISRARLGLPYGRIVDPAIRHAIATKLLLHIGLQDLSRLALEA